MILSETTREGFRRHAGTAILPLVAVALLTALFLAASRTRQRAATVPPAPPSAPPTFEREIARDVVVFNLGTDALPGMAFQSCRIVKPRVGGFRIGAFNVLEVENLRLSVPRTRGVAQADAIANGVSSVLRQSLDAHNMASFAGLKLKASALDIRGLAIDLTGADGSRTNLLQARHAKGSGVASLALEDGCLAEAGGVTTVFSHARLTLQDPVTLEIGNRRIRLDDIVK